jgi:protein subunit release factor B
MAVSPEKEEALRERMARLGVREADLEESFTRSSGPGGQKVNKTATCVHLRHLPTGIAVKSQRERSQAINRFLARRLLLDKLEGVKEQEREIIRRHKERTKSKNRRKRKRKEQLLSPQKEE